MSYKNSLDSVTVAEPCSESWDKMTGSETVRFCSHCAKNVHNLSKMTRKRARKIVADSNGGICVRYAKRPDGTIATLKRQFVQLTRQTGVTASVLGASLALTTAATAQTNIIATEQQTAVANQPGASDVSGAVSGTITDQNGAVISAALVTLSNTYFFQSASTNHEGFYEFKDVPAGNYALKVEAGGFELKEFAKIFVSGDTAQSVQLALQGVQEVVQIGGELPIGEHHFVTMGLIISTESYKRNKLIAAVESNDIEAVVKRIRQGDRVNAKDKNYNGNTALHVAVENGNVEIARYLLSAGAKINSKNANKQTPLMLLDEDAKPDLVNVLLSYSAKINLLDRDGNSALIAIADSADKDAIQLLIQAGATLDTQNKQGRTALMNAAENGNLEAVKLLLGMGANVNLTDATGETALSLAQTDEVKGFLVSYGAVESNTAENQ